ncbi:MAG: succinate dehydrogenase [Chloroflexi bacterium]|nr:MAG: succinate dehydrogenase [Chloroflexota bacterium]
MVGVMHFPQTTIGKKVIMAISGVVWIGFLAAHMFGNLKVYTGAEHFNEYAEGLRTLGAPILGYAQALWVLRIIVIVSIVAHMWAALTLNQRNRQARPARYTEHKKLSANYATLTMIYGGVAIFFFIIYHLMHFTWGVAGVHPSFIATDPYHNVIAGFSSYGYVPAIIYLIALVFLAFHLFHGTWSLFQTLGLNNKTYDGALHGLAWAVALVITLGFATVPLGVMFGLLS